MIRKPRILVVGIFVMDLIASTKQAPNRGETVIGLNFRTAPGGKGANQAVQCARLGANVTMVGRVGNDAYGRETVAAAAASGVDVSRVVVDAENPTGVSAITLEITETGAHNRIVVCPGANGAMTVEEISWIRDEVKNYDLVMLQFELPMFINEAVARWAHEAGVPVMVNPAPAAPVSPELFRCATFFSPNEHEAAAMAGHPIRVDDAGANEDDLRAVADIFRENARRERLRCGEQRRRRARAERKNARCGGHHGGGRFIRCVVQHALVCGASGAAGAGVCEPRRGHHRFASRRDPEPPDARGGNGAAARARL